MSMKATIIDYNTTVHSDDKASKSGVARGPDPANQGLSSGPELICHKKTHLI